MLLLYFQQRKMMFSIKLLRKNDCPKIPARVSGFAPLRSPPLSIFSDRIFVVFPSRLKLKFCKKCVMCGKKRGIYWCKALFFIYNGLGDSALFLKPSELAPLSPTLVGVITFPVSTKTIKAKKTTNLGDIKKRALFKAYKIAARLMKFASSL